MINLVRACQAAIRRPWACRCCVVRQAFDLVERGVRPSKVPMRCRGLLPTSLAARGAQLIGVALPERLFPHTAANC
ncbi:MAG: hypothetical protein IRY90_19945 [Actinomadura rubrobrunea]|nr:hypothetical protein [Actinomadura rubrobrunea]